VRPGFAIAIGHAGQHFYGANRDGARKMLGIVDRLIAFVRHGFAIAADHTVSGFYDSPERAGNRDQRGHKH
jgi:hypothetical protein